MNMDFRCQTFVLIFIFSEKEIIINRFTYRSTQYSSLRLKIRATQKKIISNTNIPCFVNELAVSVHENEVFSVGLNNPLRIIGYFHLISCIEIKEWEEKTMTREKSIKQWHNRIRQQWIFHSIYRFLFNKSNTYKYKLK